MSRIAIILAAVAALASLALGVMAGRWARERSAAPAPAPAVHPAGESGVAPRRDAPPEAAAADRSGPEAPAAPAAPAEPTVGEAAEAAPADPVPPQLRLEALDGGTLAELADLAGAAPASGGPAERPAEAARRALALRGLVKTAASDGIGELTHPIVAARLAGEVLARAGLALAAEQWEEAARLAGEYEAALQRAEAGYGADTIPMERILDEIELKESFASAFLEGLTERQREHLAAGGWPPPFLSPFLLAEGRVMPFAPAQRLELAERLALDIAGDFGIPGDIAARLVDQLFRDLAPLLDPASAARLAPTERVLLAGRAQAKVLQSVLRTPGIDEPARRRILAIRHWVVPDASAGR